MVNAPEVIEGIVDDVVYADPDSGYIVFDLDIGDEFITVTGTLGSIEEGEAVRVTGTYTTHAKYGDQFKADACERKLPATETAILKYLASGTIKGVGPGLAKKIVDRFSTEALTVIEEHPEQLVQIGGISASTAEQISLEFKRVNGVRTLMIFLGGYNVAPSLVMAAWKRWGQFAESVIKQDPYMLCSPDIGIDFSVADHIAADQSISPDHPSRVQAGLVFYIDQCMKNGHTCIPRSVLVEETAKILKVEETTIEDNMQTAVDEERISIYTKSDREYALLYDTDRAEDRIAARLIAMTAIFKDSGSDSKDLIDIEEKTKMITYADKQREAIAKALSGGLLILTGGPGTGKTTTLKAIISLYEQRGLKVTITAPTGRAAKRVSDLTGYPAKTIHRLLEVVFDNSGALRFKHNESDQLDTDVMIIDEMSMVDTMLFDSLLKAMKLSCRLIMVGDSDQLPSVGAGDLLRDMISSGCIPTVALNEVFRQAEQSLIVTNAHRIVNGQYPDISHADKDFFFIQRDEIDDASQMIVELCAKRLPDAYGYDVDDIQVLCPSRKGRMGTIELNKLLQQRINPPTPDKAEVKMPLCVFRDGDKVMQTKNNYDMKWERDKEKGTGVYNGDIGTVVKVKKSGSVMIDLDGRVAEYSRKALEDVELAYAMTVHKSQGSEFNAVVIPLLGCSEKLYYRNLIYTAVTRAKKQLILIGSVRVLKYMVDNDRRTLRYTCLCDRLKKLKDSK
ncbi:MAG: ATP-dependent RecD-like DNA helicase [Oscillospiraceae bacterium]|nr:ATP-dependent RecD-like DNA helicase [Oscillospiraceae bacterium]